MTYVTPKCQIRDPNTLRAKYIENSWTCYLATIANYFTVGHKKRDTFIFSITQTNIDRFSYFFTAIYNNELQNKNLLKFSPHLKSVAALYTL